MGHILVRNLFSLTKESGLMAQGADGMGEGETKKGRPNMDGLRGSLA